MVLELKTKKWGNSLGVIIPKEIVLSLNIKPEEKIMIEIEGKSGNVLKEMFGTMKSKKSSEQMIKKTHKELESKWM